jgi:hypothetical protein
VTRRRVGVFFLTGESAELLTIDGKWIRFRLEDTEDYRPLETSLMPQDLVDSMSVGQLRDLIAFLSN